jgi:8-oxo-dGTP pyrophosphatase MutT (NUDIX family)
MVRQFRPALETFTWELPAGLLDSGEDPAQGCQRELLEETGFPARSVHNLGTAAPCTGRLSNHIHSYFIETGERVADFTPEPGVMVDLKSPTELVAMIHAGTFDSQLHLGALLLAELKGLLKLPR